MRENGGYMFPEFIKFKKLFCGSLLTASLLSLPIKAMDRQEPNNNSFKKTCMDYASPFVTFGAFYYGASLAHEYAHKVVGEALLGVKGTMHFGVAPHTQFENPLNLNDIRTLATIVAGPLAGIAAVLGLLKVTNIIDEYCAGRSFLSAVKEGIKKPFFHQGVHKDEMCIARLIGSAFIAAELYHLTPHRTTGRGGYSDGYLARESIRLLSNRAAHNK